MVLTRRIGRVGHLLLNRPKALNALNRAMVDSLSDTLARWHDDPSVHVVAIQGAGGRAFCAGGDIRAIRDASLAGRHDEVEAFFAAEYALNQAIADYPKPFVALVDGICMGGGIGVSVHGQCPCGNGGCHVRDARDRYRPVPRHRSDLHPAAATG